MGEIFAVIAIALLWSFLNGELSGVNIVVGALLGLLMLGVMQRGAGRSLPRRMWGFIRYLGRFLLEMMLAGLQIARLAMSPRPNYYPHVIAVPLKLESNGAISLLMLTISLIPGTVPMGISADRSLLYAHAINARDPKVQMDGIKRIEKLILEFTI